MKLKLFGLFAGISLSALAVQPAAANAITFNATGTGSDGALAGSATFVTSAGSISVTISDTLSASQFVSAGQALSDLQFTLSNAPGTQGTLTASGQLANIGSNGSVTNVSGSPVRWIGQGPPPPGGSGTFTVNGNTILMEAIGGGQPSQMILPQATSFPNINGGFTNFNPYGIGSQTFTLAFSGVTANTNVTSATFSFGTGPDTFLPGVPVAVPGPLAGAGLPGLIAACAVLLALARRRRQLA